MSAQWFVAYSSLNCERIAAQSCKPLVRDVFLPEHDTGSRVVRGRLVESVRRPLFPRYLFLRFDAEADPWQRVLRAHGVEKVLSHGERPQAVADSVCEGLMRAARVGAFDYKKPTVALLKAGDAVRVLDGALADFLGTLIDAPDARGRIDVLLTLFGRRTVSSMHVSRVRAA